MLDVPEAAAQLDLPLPITGYFGRDSGGFHVTATPSGY